MEDELKEENQEIAVKPKSEMAIHVPPGTEDIGSDDIQIPRFKLLQKTSQEVEDGTAQPGKIKNNLTGELFDEIDVIPVAMKKTRTYFDPENRSGKPLCRSLDTKWGEGFQIYCKDCDKSRWQAQNPPECNLVYNFLLVQPDDVGVTPLPTVLSIMRSSTPVATMLNTIVRRLQEPFFNKAYKLSTKIKKFPSGSAHIFQITPLRDTDENERKFCVEVYNQFGHKPIDPEEEHQA